MTVLLRTQAQRRAELITVERYRVHLDLDLGPETFAASTTIEFTCHEPGAATFVDLRAVQVASISLNDIEIEQTAAQDGRVPLDDLAAHNTLRVESTMAYSRDGQGLHRAIDGADGKHYIYGQMFLDAAPRVFACFDQPDLKAPFDVTVRAPQEWTVLGNGAARRTAPGEWTLATTRPLATYFVTVCAGPYVSAYDTHRGVTLGLHARASLASELEEHAPQILQVTKQAYDYYEKLFDLPYEFGDYHQVFVPEFNAGAMENPGCVTLRDQYLYRGAYTQAEVMTRSDTVAHELAHMWFGNLVTLRWWDDLWLNEAFAEYMAHRTLAAATEFDETWVDFALVRKVWGYGVEDTPSTHPVAGAPAADSAAALLDFDGISYAKGAAVIRQLIAYLGDAAFVRGIRAYLRQHRDSNATFDDFLGAMEAASGVSLGAWAQAWLRTADRDTVSLCGGGSGQLSAPVTLTKTTPAAHPADRPHRLDVAAYRDGQRLVTATVTLDGPEHPVPELDGLNPPIVLLPNAADLTWAALELDEQTIASLPSQLIDVPDAEARAVLWTALIDGMRHTTIDPRFVHRLWVEAWPRETSTTVAVPLPALVRNYVNRYVRRDELDAVAADRVLAAQTVLDTRPPGSAPYLVAARLVAASSADVALLRRWTRDEQVPQGLEGDDDLRWAAVTRLVLLGEAGEAEIDAVRQRDQSMSGAHRALLAKAAIPTAAAKSWAWSALTTRSNRSNYELNSLAEGFWHRSQEDLLAPYVDRYFTDVPPMEGWVSADALRRCAEMAFPGRVTTTATRDAADAALAGAELSATMRRVVVDGRSRLDDALRSLGRYGG